MSRIDSLRRQPRRLAVSAILVVAALAAGGWWSWRQFTSATPLRLAQRAWDHHQLAAAMRQLQSGLKRTPNDRQLQFLAARVARRLGELDDADAYLQRCSQDAGVDAATWSVEKELVDVQRRGVSVDAEPKLRAWADRHPALRSLIYEALAEGCLREFRLPAAMTFLDQAIAEMPDNVVALRRRGNLHMQLADFAEAVLDLRRAAELDPADTHGQLLLADALVKAGRFADALPLLEQQRAQSPKNVTVLTGLAICREAAGDFDRAKSLLIDALDVQPRHAVALLELGRLHFESGQPQIAENWLRQSLEADPTDRRANHLLFQALRMQGKDGQAEQQLATARRVQTDLARLSAIMTDELTNRPNDPNLHYELGMLHLRNGQPKQGVHWLEQALKLDARHRPSHRALAQYYDDAGQPDRAALHRSKMN